MVPVFKPVEANELAVQRLLELAQRDHDFFARVAADFALQHAVGALRPGDPSEPTVGAAAGRASEAAAHTRPQTLLGVIWRLGHAGDVLQAERHAEGEGWWQLERAVEDVVRIMLRELER